MQIRAEQIQDGVITNTQVSVSAAIATSKLADGSKIFMADGTVAATADLDMGGNKLTNLGAPTSNSDAARKQDVDAVAAGISHKDSVTAASTANVTLATDVENGDSLDGVTLATGDRILLKDQTDASENGIYAVAASGAPSRVTDADTAAEIASAFVFVQEGTTNADTAWVCTMDEGDTLGTDNCNWTQFSSAGGGDTAAGAGLTKSGNTIDAVAADNSLTINANDIAVNVDNSTLETDGTNGVQVMNQGITETQLHTSVAGNGLAGGNGTALSVNVDDSSIEISADTLQVKANGITATEIAAAVAGDGLTGGGGSALAVNTDSSSLTIISDQVQVNAEGITETHLNATVAGDGLAGGGGTALAVNVDDSSIEISANTLQVKASGITETHLNATVAGDGLTGGGGTALAVNVDNTTLTITSDVISVASDIADHDDFVTGEEPTGDLDGVDVTYTLANAPISGSLAVYLNGMRQKEGGGEDYTLSGSTITFATAPESGDKILADYIYQSV